MIIRYSKKFSKTLNKIRNLSTREKISKQIKKIVKNPEVGKPLRHGLKGERTLYIHPYRLIYSIENKDIILLRFEHRKKVYRQ